MTIDEAIRLKKEYRDNHYIPLGSKIAEADNLSIEALDLVRRSRSLATHNITLLLPGETEE